MARDHTGLAPYWTCPTPQQVAVAATRLPGYWVRSRGRYAIGSKTTQ
jgi:hypothetical protein